LCAVNKERERERERERQKERKKERNAATGCNNGKKDTFAVFGSVFV